MAKIRGKITLYNRAGLRDNIPCQYIFDETPFYETQKISDKSQSEAISEINKNLSNAIAQLQNQIETITGTKPDNIYRVVYDVDWSRIKADHNDYTNGVNHFEIIDKQDNEVLWAEVYCNNIGSGNQPCNNFYSYQVDNGIINEHRFWEDGNLNVPLGYNWRGGGTEGSISNTYIFTVKVRAAKILKFIDPVMEKALSAYYANTVTNVAGYGLVHVDNKLLDVEAEKITSLDSTLHTRTGISDIWHDLKTTEDFKLLPNLTAFNGSIIAASSNYITDLDTLYIPKSVKEINGFLISYIPDFTLKHIVVEEGNPVFDSRDNCDCLIRTADNAMIGGCMNSKIPASVTTVDGWWYGKGIKRLSLPDTLTSWPSSNTDSSPAHYKTFPDLEYLRLSAGVKEYLGNVSKYNPNLKELIIPEGIEVINSGDALIYSGKVTQLEIPSTITTIAPPAFYSQGSVKKVIFHCIYSNDTWNWSPYIGEEYVFDNDVIFPDNYSGQFIPNNLKKLTFTDNCTIIPKQFASRNNNYIEELNFGKGLTEIPDNAFAGGDIYNIEKLYLPENIKTIGESAFAGRQSSMAKSKLKSVIAPGVKTIGNNAFINHQNLENLYAPNVENVGSSAFQYSGLKQINLPSVKTIDDLAFMSYAGKIESINIPNVESIGTHAFNCPYMPKDFVLNCPKLKVINQMSFSGYQGKLILGTVESLNSKIFGQDYFTTYYPVVEINANSPIIGFVPGGTIILTGEGDADITSWQLSTRNVINKVKGNLKANLIRGYNIVALEDGTVELVEGTNNYAGALYIKDFNKYALTTTAPADVMNIFQNGGPSLVLLKQYSSDDYTYDYNADRFSGEIDINPIGDLTEIQHAVFFSMSNPDVTFNIGEGITKIGKHAFNTRDKHKINVPASVVEVEEYCLASTIPYFYGTPPIGIENAFLVGTIYVKPEYLEQWQAVEWQGDVTIEVMDE